VAGRELTLVLYRISSVSPDWTLKAHVNLRSVTPIGASLEPGLLEAEQSQVMVASRAPFEWWSRRQATIAGPGCSLRYEAGCSISWANVGSAWIFLLPPWAGEESGRRKPGYLTYFRIPDRPLFHRSLAFNHLSHWSPLLLPTTSCFLGGSCVPLRQTVSDSLASCSLETCSTPSPTSTPAFLPTR
jgi:hypothetical protein